MRNNRGVTLIMLVITVIVLIMLTTFAVYYSPAGIIPNAGGDCKPVSQNTPACPWRRIRKWPPGSG